ncbi:MAG: glycosyltransferase family 2 protein [Desulfocapsa sp.]|nr:MAG: glycosyltransferase family 2 protein [Desulfocapsa sp.]
MKGISVVIPTYNREKLLIRALQSVAEQRLNCNEIVVVDDGSTDCTKQRVEEFAAASTLTVIYLYQNNKGPAAARNIGIHTACYDTIAFLDSDDHWHKRKIELQYAALEKNPDLMISHTREKWLRRGKHLNQKKKHQPGNGDIFAHCLQLCAVGMSTVMLRKKLFDSVGFFNEKYRCCEDYDLWLRTSCRYPFLMVEEPLTIKEGGREDQVSFQYRIGMDKLRIASMRDLLKAEILSDSQQKMCLLELRRKCTVYGKGCLKHEKPEEGKHYLAIAHTAEEEAAR